MMRAQGQLLGHVGDHVRLADGLPAGNRQRLVGIGSVGELALDEALARHLVQGPQHRRVADATAAQRQQELHMADVLRAAR